MVSKVTPVTRSAGEQQKVERSTRNRTPFGVPTSKLGIATPIEGYHLHWVNDSAGRLMQAQNGGYEFVLAADVGIEATDGDRVKRLVGRDEDGSALYAYLMKIRQEWYEEDQNMIQSQVDAFDAAIAGGTLENIGNSYSDIKYGHN